MMGSGAEPTDDDDSLIQTSPLIFSSDSPKLGKGSKSNLSRLKRFEKMSPQTQYYNRYLDWVRKVRHAQILVRRSGSGNVRRLPARTCLKSEWKG